MIQDQIKAIKRLRSAKNLSAKYRIGIFFQKAWKVHKWIFAQPEFGKGKDNIASFVIYFLFFTIACVPIYDILFYKNTFTDIETKYPSHSPIPVPDVIVCPGPNSCVGCEEPFKSYKFAYNAWWNYDTLKLLNISNDQLNFIAEIAHKRAFGKQMPIPGELTQLIEMASHNFKNYEQYKALNRELSENSSTLHFDLLWYLLVKIPRETYINLRRNSDDGIKYYNKYLHLNVSWLNRAFCLLHKNTEGLTIYTINYRLVMQYPVKSKYWLGNITSEVVHYDYLYTTTDDSIRQARHIETVIVKDHSLSSGIKYVCQNEISEYSEQTCRNEYLHQYTFYLIHETTDDRKNIKGVFDQQYSRISMHFDMPIWLISKHNVYSWLATVEITMGIFCLFLGCSCYQIITLLTVLLGKRWSFIKTFTFDIVVIVILLLCTIMLLIADFNTLFSPSITQQISIGSTMPMLSFGITANFALNFTLLQSLNVSCALIQYIYLASSMALMGHRQGGISRSWFMDLRYLRSTKRSNTCIKQVSELHEEYKLLADKLNVDSTAPAIVLLEQLFIDKCQYILSCRFNGKKHDGCCKHFKLGFYENTNSFAAYFVKNNSNKTFKLAETKEPDIQLIVNQSVVSLGPPYADLFYNRCDYFALVNPHTKHYKIPQYVKRYSEVQGVRFGFVTNFSFVAVANPTRLLQGDIVQVSLRFDLVKEIPKEHSTCVNTTVCIPTFAPTWLIKKIIATNAKNLYLYKHCGCFVCFNEKSPVNKKCCSAEEAVNCMLNPLLFVRNLNISSCKKSDVICDLNSDSDAMCSAVHKNRFLDVSKGYRFLPMKKYDTKNTDYFPKHPGSNENLSFDALRKQLKDIGCGNVSNKIPHLCPHLRPNYEFSIVGKQRLKTNNELTTIELRMDRDSILNSYELSRSNRQYSFLEAIGICLAGFGLFLGIDILCLIESFVNVFSSKNHTLQHVVRDSFIPIQMHLMRMFRSLRETKDNQSEDNSIANDEKSERKKGNKNNTSNQKANEDHDEDEDNETSMALSGVLFVAAVFIFISGLGICVYVGSSDFLAAKEYNLNIVYEKLPHQYPAFAVCTSVDFNDIHHLKFPWKNPLLNILNNSKCWVEMADKPCHRLFKVYIFSERFHCWLTDNESKQFKATKQLLQHNEFIFIMATERKMTKNIGMSVWFGNFENALGGIISPIPLLQLKYNHLVLSYQEAQNDTCISQISCPTCSKTKLSGGCCANYHHHNTYNINDTNKSRCSRIFKGSAEQHNLSHLRHALYSSSIFNRKLEFNVGAYSFWGVRRSVPYVFIFHEMARHSLGAKFAMVSGYIDLFLGLSVVAFGGTVILGLWKKIKVKIHTISGKVFPLENVGTN